MAFRSMSLALPEIWELCLLLVCLEILLWPKSVYKNQNLGMLVGSLRPAGRPENFLPVEPTRKAHGATSALALLLPNFCPSAGWLLPPLESTNVRMWLVSACSPLPDDDSSSPIPVPGWFVIHIGNSIPHSSHNLYSIRGIVFCQCCGVFSSKKCRLLNRPCQVACSPFSARALAKLGMGELPAANMRWPRKPGNGFMRPPPPQPDDASDNACLNVAPVSAFDDPNADIWEQEKFEAFS